MQRATVYAGNSTLHLSAGRPGKRDVFRECLMPETESNETNDRARLVNRLQVPVAFLQVPVMVAASGVGKLSLVLTSSHPILAVRSAILKFALPGIYGYNKGSESTLSSSSPWDLPPGAGRKRQHTSVPGSYS